VVQEVEMGRVRQVHPVVDLERDLPPASLARGARELNQQVSDHRPLALRERGAHEVVGRAVEERHLVQVRLGAGAEAQVLDAYAAAVHDLRERACLGQPVERVAGGVCALLERCAQVR
jgi:hypothetical protein